MSKLARKPIPIPEGVKAEIKDKSITVSGKEGTITFGILAYVSAEVAENGIVLKSEALHKQARANLGTTAALIKNALEGVKQGFTKSLEIEGIGFKAVMEGNKLVLNVGYTHPVKLEPPAGIKISVEKNVIKVSGVDRALVGQIAAAVRKIKKPEPYKGKGIHYVGEVIRRKEGKKVAGTGTGTTT